MGRLSYLVRSAVAYPRADRFRCPNCGSPSSHIEDRKYFVTQLRRCAQCALLFRAPTDPIGYNTRFYETEYNQGFTTDLPNDQELECLKATNFSDTEKNYGYYINVLRQLGIAPDARIFDFGCSWGYGSFQLKNAGFDVVAFEVAP